MSIIKFLKQAFSDMKESAKEQHEVDKANFQAEKVEAKARYEEAKNNSSPTKFKEKQKAERKESLSKALERRAAAEKRIEQVKNAR